MSPRGSYPADRRCRPARPWRRRLSRPPTSGAPRAVEVADERYVVANGFEADPGAQVDRTLMESDPHAVLEGVALAAYAVGAHAGASSPSAPTSTTALRRCSARCARPRRPGYLGSDALGAGFDIHVEVSADHRRHGRRRGDDADARDREQARPARPAAAVSRRARACGAGRRSSTTSRRWPPCPGSWPTARRPSPPSATTGKPGTTLVQVSGAVAQAGHRRGAAGHVAAQAARRRAAASATAKAVLVGGPAGGFLPPAELDTLYTPAALTETGAIMGSGTSWSSATQTCLVDMATLLDALPVRRVVRQDHPLPHRTAPPVRARPAARRPACRAQSTPGAAQSWPPTSATARCAGSSTARPIRS